MCHRLDPFGGYCLLRCCHYSLNRLRHLHQTNNRWDQTGSRTGQTANSKSWISKVSVQKLQNTDLERLQAALGAQFFALAKQCRALCFVKALHSPVHLPYPVRYVLAVQDILIPVNSQAKMALDVAGHCLGRVMITDRSKLLTSRSLNRPCTSGVAPLARATSWSARCSDVNKLIQQQLPSSKAAKDMLNWLADRRGAIRTAVKVDESPSTAGRRLLANRNFAADEILMSVPLTSVFVDIEVSCQLIES